MKVLVLAIALVACGSKEVRTIQVERPTTYECVVPEPEVIETEVVVEVPVINEITKEVVVETEVIKEIEIEKIIEVEKIKKITLPIEYFSYQCGRHIIKHGNKVYAINSGLVLLTDAWYKISSTCKLRYKKNKLEVGS